MFILFWSSFCQYRLWSWHQFLLDTTHSLNATVLSSHSLIYILQYWMPLLSSSSHSTQLPFPSDRTKPTNSTHFYSSEAILQPPHRISANLGLLTFLNDQEVGSHGTSQKVSVCKFSISLASKKIYSIM
jgi:hypothetical protein